MIEKLTQAVVAAATVLGRDILRDERPDEVELDHSGVRPEAERWVARAIGSKAAGSTPEDALRGLRTVIAGRVTTHLANLDAERARVRGMADELARLAEQG